MSKVAKIFGILTIAGIMFFSIVNSVNADENYETDEEGATFIADEEPIIDNEEIDKEKEAAKKEGNSENEMVYTIGAKTEEKTSTKNDNNSVVYITLGVGICLIAVTGIVAAVYKKRVN